MQLNTYRDQVIRRLEIDCYITHFSFSFLFVRWQKGGLTAKQRAGHRGGVPDGFYKDGSLVWNVILWTVHHRCQLWLKHLVGSHVHIGDSTTEPERRPRHGEPARCYGGPPGLPGAGHRANPWNGRGLASSLITSYLPCHSTVIAASSLPRISKVEAQIVYNKCIERNIFQVIFLKLFIRKCKILYMFYFHQGLQLLSFFFLLCSRYLLITKQWEEEARKALRRLRASNQVEEDIEEMRAEERAQQAESRISMTELICSPTLRAPLIIGVVMQLSQQLSGINAVSSVVHKFRVHCPLYNETLNWTRWTCSHLNFETRFIH